MKNYYEGLGYPDKPISNAPAGEPGITPKVNGHIHTPHSFSSFSSMEQPFRMAVSEGISVLGINDFYTTDGYGEFAELANRYGIFPLFNIEFMALQKWEQEAGIRINDPQNPGRTYLSGKGLSFPEKMSTESRRKLNRLCEESNRQTYEMTSRLNQFLKNIAAGLHFDPVDMQARFARNLLRERHIAAAVRTAVFEKHASAQERISLLTALFSGKRPVSSLSDIAGLENEIRNNLLKTGGPAFVEEDEKAFLSLEEVVSLIRDAGGIPCYPVLLDDPDGRMTDFESDFHGMAETLKAKGIFMTELIPGRNSITHLKEFVRFFDREGFIITFGTEHNTPRLDPLTISCRGGVPLDEELMQVNYRGASIIAAHQYLTASGKAGFPAGEFPSRAMSDFLDQTGMKIISNFIRLYR